MSVLKIMLAGLLLMFSGILAATTTSLSFSPTPGSADAGQLSYDGEGGIFVGFNAAGEFEHTWTLQVDVGADVLIDFSSNSGDIDNFIVYDQTDSSNQLQTSFQFLGGDHVFTVQGNFVNNFGYSVATTILSSATPSMVPLPNSIWFMISAVLGLCAFRRPSALARFR